MPTVHAREQAFVSLVVFRVCIYTRASLKLIERSFGCFGNQDRIVKYF